MSDERPEATEWPCWACGNEITGAIYQAFSMTQRWKGDPAREGSYTRVVLCLGCKRRVMTVLYAIQDEADHDRDAAPRADVAVDVE